MWMRSQQQRSWRHFWSVCVHRLVAQQLVYDSIMAMGIKLKIVVLLLLAVGQVTFAGQADTKKAVVIPCTGMIDDGLYRSIRRRSESAIKVGADYLIYQISTYGGLAEAADNISKYLIFDVPKRARTVAYISTEAISAGAMIAVSCQDVIMRSHSTIGDCAPIALGQRLEGVEREKTESFIRATFDRAAKANGYPAALLRAMVTMEVELYRVRNRQTGEYEFFEQRQIPNDPNRYELATAELIDPNDRILTLHAEDAHRYGLARAVVEDVNDLVAFLEDRDGVTIDRPLPILETTWSEEMVRMLNHPVVSGVILTIALIAIYMELSTPGIGLPGLVALICLVILGASKYMTGLANWLEVALVIVGLVLLFLELFVLPGFGFVGITGIACLLAGLFGMLVKNPPNRPPWPQTQQDWNTFVQGSAGLLIGVGGFVVFLVIAARYLPKFRVFGGLVLVPGGTQPQGLEPDQAVLDQMAPDIGQVGVVESTLRPAGKVRFDKSLVDCIAYGLFVAAGTKVRVVEVQGNKVFVEPLKDDSGGHSNP